MRSTSLLAVASLCAVYLASCAIKPFAICPDGTKISLGSSLGTKSDFEVASATAPNGTRLSYETGRHDETIVPSNYLKAGVLKQAITSAAHSTDVATKANAGTDTSIVPVAAAGIGAAVISRPSNQIPLPVMEARKPSKSDR